MFSAGGVGFVAGVAAGGEEGWSGLLLGDVSSVLA